MMKYSCILVTGCGGDIGSGIGRILKSKELADRVIGCDIHNEHPGSTIFDQTYVVPRVDSPEYLTELSDIIDNNKVDLIVPISEPELRYLLKSDMLDTICNIPLISPNKLAMEIGFDKLMTSRFLQSIGMLFPWTSIVNDGDPIEIPCVIKSRQGAGSKDVNIVKRELLEYYMQYRSTDIFQEYLKPDDQEYTCGIYRTLQGDVRTMIIRRKLQGGFTVYGEVVESSDIHNELLRLAEALDLRGSINVQLRLTNRGPVIFEINPRFSSTVVFRHMLGFKDLVWSICEKSGEKLESYEPTSYGTRFYRGSHEIILSN